MKLSECLTSQSGCASTHTENLIPRTVEERQILLCTYLPHHQLAYVAVSSCCVAIKLSLWQAQSSLFLLFFIFLNIDMIDATVHEVAVNRTSCGRAASSSVAGHELWRRQPLPAA